jgi:large-conductance mechanosensitive channel
VLVILGILLVAEIVADKVPVVDSINDWIHGVVRPAAGGIAFGTGAASETAVVSDPAAFFTSNAWTPIAIGVVLAFATHATKMLARPMLNAATAGAAAPVVSAVEDVSSVLLSFMALLAPVVGFVVLLGLVTLVVLRVRHSRHSRRSQRSQRARLVRP